MERSTIFHGNTHYFDWAIFNSYVKLPEGIVVCNLYMDIYRVGGWATSWNIVNGKDDIPYMKWKIHVWNHRLYIYIWYVPPINHQSVPVAIDFGDESSKAFLGTTGLGTNKWSDAGPEKPGHRAAGPPYWRWYAPILMRPNVLRITST